MLDEFVAKLVAEVEAFRLGRGLEVRTTHGPLVNSAAVDKTDMHVRDALSKGAILHTGGGKVEDSQGFFYKPTVLSNVPRNAQVAQDETFGPLAPIFSFQTPEEALKLANGTNVGLAGYFFSRNISRVMQVAKALEVGVIGVNTGLISAAESPFGGVKQSGLGREGSKYGLAEYQNIKAVTISHGSL